MTCFIDQHTPYTIGAFADFKWKIIWEHLKILKVLVDMKKLSSHFFQCSFYWFIGSIDRQYRTCKGIKNFESLTQSWYDKPLFAYFEFTYCEPCSIVLNIQLGIKINTLLLESRILNSNTNLVALRTCPWPRWHICMSWPCQSSPWPCSSVLLTPLCNIE